MQQSRSIVREIELVFGASMSVEARHEGCRGDKEHQEFHLKGGLDVVKLHLGNKVTQGDRTWCDPYMPPLPEDVYADGCRFNHTVVITGNDRGIVITAGVLGQRPPVFAFEWFDILVGSELAYVRRSLAQSAQHTSEPVRNGQILEIPAATVDRMADLIRQSHQRHSS